MKRRKLRGIEYAQDGPHGRPAAEIKKRWMSRAKRRMQKMERQDAKRLTQQELVGEW